MVWTLVFDKERMGNKLNEGKRRVRVEVTRHTDTPCIYINSEGYKPCR